MRRYDFVNGIFGGFWALGLAYALLLGGLLVLSIALDTGAQGGEEGAVGWSPIAMFHGWGFSEHAGPILTLSIPIGIFLAGFWVGQKILRDRPIRSTPKPK